MGPLESGRSCRDGGGERGRILARHEVGFANIEHRVRATAKNRFQVASLSKQFLGALALLLAGEGQLDLDADAAPSRPCLNNIRMRSR